MSTRGISRFFIICSPVLRFHHKSTSTIVFIWEIKRSANSRIITSSRIHDEPSPYPLPKRERERVRVNVLPSSLLFSSASCHLCSGNISLLIDEIKISLCLFYTAFQDFFRHSHSPPFLLYFCYFLTQAGSPPFFR